MAHYWLVQPKSCNSVTYRGRKFTKGNIRMSEAEIEKYSGSSDLSYSKIEVEVKAKVKLSKKKKVTSKPNAKDSDKAPQDNQVEK